MHYLIVVVVLALGAAFSFALAAYLQRIGARQVMAGKSALHEASGIRRLLQGLPGNRTWLLGTGANFAAFFLHAAALVKGSVALVQPFVSTQLMFVVGLASWRERRWPALRDCLSAAAVCAGLALLLTTETRVTLSGAPDRDRILLSVALAVVGVVSVVIVGRLVAGWLSSMMVGVGAGLCQAMNAGFMKMSLHDWATGGLDAMLRDWPIYSLPFSVLGGVVLGQLAFTSGSLPPAVAAMSVTNPVASMIFGLAAFQVQLPPRFLVAVVVSGTLITIGIIGLAAAGSTQRLFGEAEVPEPEKPSGQRLE